MKTSKQNKSAPILKAAIVIGFIIFLFYSNLLMREFTRSSSAQGKGLIFAIEDIFSATNFVIAIISALTVYVVFEKLRKKLL